MNDKVDPLPPPEQKAAYVRGMFGRIARRYDLMNRLMTLGQDRSWRRDVVARATVPPIKRVLDVATGTGDLALEVLRQRPGVQVVGIDFTPEMLALAQKKASGLQADVGLLSGDALRLPFTDGAFDAVVTAFALRNVTDIPVAFSEMARVTGTERKQAEKRIEHLAHHDALTGLPNRLLLRDRFERAVALADRNDSHVALLFLDLDNFKVVNDTLGHAAGDLLLQRVVARLRECVRHTDTLSREGGDEFIVLLEDIPYTVEVERIAGEMLRGLVAPIEIDEHMLSTSGSIGICLYPEDGRNFDTLLQKADTAMYAAKEAGRDGYRFFDVEMDRRAQEHLSLQHRLHQALVAEELELHYQPQIELAGGRVVGVEALLRWSHPELGEVSPERFVRVAEDCGLIVPIGGWVLEQACMRAQRWAEEGLGAHMLVSVNISALQLRHGDLVEAVAAVLDRSGLPPERLELELTESVLLHDAEQALETLGRLKAMGVGLAIDDFGTGYSSLSYLRRLPVDRLKIDGSFVRNLATDPDSAAIVNVILQLAGSLRLRALAEGVETSDQLEFLRAAGCAEAQGYLFSPALNALDLERWIRARDKG